MRFSVSTLFLALFLVACAAESRAFCIENDTDTRLFFAARVKGEAAKRLIFRQWVEGGARACHANNLKSHQFEVFVFADEDSIEGCDDEVDAGRTLRLKVFAEFDNCAWTVR